MDCLVFFSLKIFIFSLKFGNNRKMIKLHSSVVLIRTHVEWAAIQAILFIKARITILTNVSHKLIELQSRKKNNKVTHCRSSLWLYPHTHSLCRCIFNKKKYFDYSQSYNKFSILLISLSLSACMPTQE